MYFIILLFSYFIVMFYICLHLCPNLVEYTYISVEIYEYIYPLWNTLPLNIRSISNKEHSFIILTVTFLDIHTDVISWCRLTYSLAFLCIVLFLWLILSAWLTDPYLGMCRSPLVLVDHLPGWWTCA